MAVLIAGLGMRREVALHFELNAPLVSCASALGLRWCGVDHLGACFAHPTTPPPSNQPIRRPSN